jgi:hypothetical protein
VTAHARVLITAAAFAITAAPATGRNTITIHNFMFGDPITVKAGSKVTVMN